MSATTNYLLAQEAERLRLYIKEHPEELPAIRRCLRRLFGPDSEAILLTGTKVQQPVAKSNS